MERLIRILKENKDVADFKITTVKKHSYQLFFVKDKIETNRLVDSTSYVCTVYYDKDDKRGNAFFDYAPYLTDEEVKEKIKDAIFNASLTLNKHFDLPKKQDKPMELDSNFKGADFAKLAEDVSKAIFANEMNENLYTAATEIFINKINKRIINSQGLDVEEELYQGQVEMIPTYETKEKEVEIYHTFNFSNFDFEEIKNLAFEGFVLAKDRYFAIDLPKGLQGTNIIMNSPDMDKMFKFFTDNLSYTAKFYKSNLFEVGQSVTGDVTSDITITKAPYFKGCFNSEAFDDDGIVLKDRVVIENGKAVSMFGGIQTASYIGEKDVTGNLPLTIVKEGKVSFEEMKKKPYIRCVRFSSLQQDSSNGLIGGEVRLAYYFDGEKEIPVTGFTFTGNMLELKSSLVFSKETITLDSYHGPKYIGLPKTQII